MSKAIGHVVVQTHWDREWYFTRERTLARLIRAASHFVAELEAGKLDSFLFDGQTIAAEDLLAACEPALADRLRTLMADGRLVLGPWYVSADEFLVDGECLIRNLERGMATAQALGNCQRVGYVPDTFGHRAQMPQILQGFGIDNAVLWRGSDHPRSEAWWQAPDGSQVFAVLLTQGYYQHPFNMPDRRHPSNGPDWQKAVADYFKSVKPAATTGHLLLTQGGDHLITAAGMADRLAAFNAEQDEFRSEQSRLEDYIASVRAETGDLAVLSGELRQNDRAFVLPDVLSTRRYLKEANQRAEDRLIGLVEPLLAVTAWQDKAFPKRYLAATWDLLLQQQPHDSICGCSVDAVHDEMMTRFAALSDRMDALIETAGLTSGRTENRAILTDRLSPFADDRRCTLFNASPKRADGWVEAEVFLAGAGAAGLSAMRMDGEAIDVAFLAVEPHRAFTSPLDDFPAHVAGHRYRLAFRTELQGLEMAAIELKDEPAHDDTTGEVVRNEHFELRVDGTGRALRLTDRTSGLEYAGLFAIESTLDAGDSYNYSPPPRPEISRADVIGWRTSGIGTACETLTLDLALDQPAGLAPDRVGAAADRVRSEGRLTLRLLAGEPMVRATLTWHNAARDHRLRLVLPLPEPVADTASDGGFAWTTRPVTFAEVPDAPSRAEARVSVNPSHSAVAAGPFGFIHRGLQEFEVERSAAGDRLGITLLRSVGWLSRRDLVTRGMGAGPDMATPGAQCLGEHRYDFALSLDTEAVALLGRAAAWRRPPALLRGHAPPSPAGMTLSDERLQVSSLRRLDDAIELRVWNPTGDAVPVYLPGWETNAIDLAREPLPEWQGNVAPFGIQTLLLSRQV